MTPLALLGTGLGLAWPAGGQAVLLVAAHAGDALTTAVGALDALPGAHWITGTPAWPALGLAVVGCGMLLAPWPKWRKAWLLLAFLPLAVRSPQRPATEELRVTVIDVGQGMAVLVESHDYRLLYDTGPRYAEEADAGRRILLPWLRAHGVDRLDALVVSHGDSDHSGGALALLRGLAIDTVWTSLAPDDPIVQAAGPRHRPCVRGAGWQADSHHFAWLHPEPAQAPDGATAGSAPNDRPSGADRTRKAGKSSNARSCVLRVTGPAGVLLLPGDVEAPQERQLLTRLAPDDIAADVLIAPHHGSTTSSTVPFVAAVHPRIVVFQVGYRNRFGHPRAVVVQRYRQTCSTLLRTDSQGEIGISMAPGRAPEIRSLRRDAPRYWQVRMTDPATDPPAPAIADPSDRSRLTHCACVAH